MPESHSHRGPHPGDKELFHESAWADLAAAAEDLSMLLSRGYSGPATLKLVGDRYNLRARQRVAVGRIACDDQEVTSREGRHLSADNLRGRELWIDGFNVLTSVEAALSKGYILAGRDGCYRDMASMHGNYRVLEQTRSALALVMSVLVDLAPSSVTWFLDRPVSNSGRLKVLVGEMAETTNGYSIPTQVQVVPDPDAELASLEGDSIVAVTADSGILDRCGAWCCLARLVIERRVPESVVVDVVCKEAG